MKVKIGPYPNYLNTKQIEKWYLTTKFKIPYYEVDERKYSRVDRAVLAALSAIDTALHYTVNKLIRSSRKIDVKIDNSDCWNMAETLSVVIAPMLRKLKDTKSGSPFIEDEDVPEELKSTSVPPVPDHMTDDNHHKRWDYVLDEMIWAFEQLEMGEITDTHWEDQYHSGESDIKFVPVNHDDEESDEPLYYEMVKGPNDTHSFDRDGSEAHMARMQNGFRLFGKYYMHLWT